MGKRPARDPNAPKRNMSAYLLYQNAMRDRKSIDVCLSFIIVSVTAGDLCTQLDSNAERTQSSSRSTLP